MVILSIKIILSQTTFALFRVRLQQRFQLAFSDINTQAGEADDVFFAELADGAVKAADGDAEVICKVLFGERNLLIGGQHQKAEQTVFNGIELLIGSAFAGLSQADGKALHQQTVKSGFGIDHSGKYILTDHIHAEVCYCLHIAETGRSTQAFQVANDLSFAKKFENIVFTVIFRNITLTDAIHYDISMLYMAALADKQRSRRKGFLVNGIAPRRNGELLHKR